MTEVEQTLLQVFREASEFLMETLRRKAKDQLPIDSEDVALLAHLSGTALTLRDLRSEDAPAST